MKKPTTKAQKAKRTKVNVIYIYVIVTIALVFFALLVSSQSFFNPLNFQSDSICYLERVEYNNPMLISYYSGDQPESTYVFQDKQNLYAMFIYMQQAELVPLADAMGADCDIDAMIKANTTSVFEIFSQSVEKDHVFLFYDLGDECNYLIVECMPDYPEGELKLMAIEKTENLTFVVDSLKSTANKGMEAN